MTTIYNTKLRLGGAYLINNLGGYILTKNGEKIIVKVPGGYLNTTIYTVRIPI